MERIEGILYSDNHLVAIEIEDGFICKIERITHSSSENSKKQYVAPALIDNQVNGYRGIEFSFPDLSETNMRKVTAGIHEKGIGAFLPTVITASHESLMRSFKNLSSVLKDAYIAEAVPGFHLEGPYISPEAGYRGAHNVEDIRLPDWDEFQQLNEQAEGKIIQITLAPELEGAENFIKKCVKNDIVVSLGHHNANAKQIKTAVDAGAKTVTHLGNGCANTIHRFDNPFWMQLADDRLMSSIIVDGFHLPPELVRVFYKVKGSERLILTSDMTMLSGMPPGKYKWSKQNVVLTEEGMIKNYEKNVFAGSSVTLDRDISNMMAFTGCGLNKAVNMATKNPAKLYGFKDRGMLEVGKRADLILFDYTEGEIKIKKTIVAGKTVYDVNNDSVNTEKD